jgi:hypothetical protein
MDALREILLPRLENIRLSGGQYSARCPAHDDGRASLSVAEGKDQPVVITCFAGCQTEDILAKIGLTWEALCSPREQDRGGRGEWTPHGEAIAVYDYTDETGQILFQVCRTADKQFPQRTPDRTKKTGWRWNTNGTRRVLYRLPKVIEAVSDGEMIWVAEGEKDVHALELAGVTATCNPGGAGKWRPEYAEFLRGVIVSIVADKDKPGQAHARQVAASLDGIALAVQIVEAAGEHKDAAAHLAAGLGIPGFEVTWEQGEPTPDLAPDLYEFLAIDDPAHDWVIPGLLERGDRLIWTGFEGLGKSVITRQLAICAAAGVHPFEDHAIPQQRVLFIDCENPDRKSRRHFRELERKARANGFPVPPGAFRIIQRPEGIDLTTDEDRAWLLERVTAHKPDLLVIGPFYRLHMADTNDERPARAVVAALDAARVKADCALITEAHAGHAPSGGFTRNLRPIGSSLLMRWPEFGYGIMPHSEAEPDESGRCRLVQVKAWRGPREERHWPAELMWGTHDLDWPWVPATALTRPVKRSA